MQYHENTVQFSLPTTTPIIRAVLRLLLLLLLGIYFTYETHIIPCFQLGTWR